MSASIGSLFPFLLFFPSGGRSCADINQQKLLRDKWKIWLVVGISVMILSPNQGTCLYRALYMCLKYDLFASLS